MMRINRLPLLAALLLLTACATDTLSPEQQTQKAVPQEQSATGTHLVYYRATVSDGDGNGHTRATLNTDGNYVYSAADMLFVRSTGEDAGKVYGALRLNSQDAGKTTGITFEGNLQVANGFEPLTETHDTPLEAILVGADAQLYTFNNLGDQIIGPITWPQDGALAATLAQAVERYSTLTAQSTYSQQSFQLSQGSCFVDFSVTLDDATTAGSEIGAYVWTDADIDKRTIRSGTVTTVNAGGAVKANFVAAFPGGTVLDGAVVGLGGRNAIAFGGSGTTLTANNIYHVTRTFTREAATISFDVTSMVKSHPDARFPIAVHNTGDGVVTYTSDNEAVATVAYDDVLGKWMVTIVNAGEANLTASVTDGANYAYTNHTASYHLTVYDPVSLASVTAAHIGWVIGTDDKVYVTSTGVTAAYQNAVAMIGYVGDSGSADASSTTYRGLAIALNEASSEPAAWTDNVNIVCTGSNACNQVFSEAVASMRGIQNTARLVAYECRTDASDTHTHDAAEAVAGYHIPFFDVPADHGCSDWFLPTTGQWFKVFKACGVATDLWTGLGNCPDSAGRNTDNPDNHCADNYTAIHRLMSAVGVPLSGFYWTSTERTSGRFAFYVGFDSSYGVEMHIYSKSSLCNVRPFIAF